MTDTPEDDGTTGDTPALRFLRAGRSGELPPRRDSPAPAMSQRGDSAAGVRLLAAGDADGPRFGSQRALSYMMPRDEFEASLAAARADLGEADFQQAWAAGKGMTPDQAVAGALAVPEIIRAAPLRGRPGSGPHSPLTSRQQEVAVLVAQGLTNRQIGNRLTITPRAAAARCRNASRRLVR